MISQKDYIRLSEKRLDKYSKLEYETYKLIEKKNQEFINEINKDIENLFKSLDKDEITKKEAHHIFKSRVTKSQLNEVRTRIYSTDNKTLRKQLIHRHNDLLKKEQITQLELLKEKLYINSRLILDYQTQKLTNCFTEILKDSYNYNIYLNSLRSGYAFQYTELNDRIINLLMRERFHGKNFNARLKNHTLKFYDTTTYILTKGFANGFSIQRMAEDFQKRSDVKNYEALRLMRTESTRYYNLGEQYSREECGIDKYMIVATLDHKTSNECQKQDGQIHKTSEFEEGVTAPPFHWNCRSTTISVIDKNSIKFNERIAKDKNGQNIKVDGSMKYSDYKKIYLKGA